MTLPLCLLTFVSEGNWLFGVVYLLGFTCLWLTFSLAGLLGFVAALIVVVAVLFVQKKLSRRVVAKLAGAMLLSLVVGVLNLGIFKDRIYDSVVDLKKVVRSQTVVYAQEVQDGDHKISDPGFIREGLWQGTWHLITSSPKVLLIGTGPETFPYAFQPYRPLVLNYSSEWNFVFNKPHNYYLELWAEKGLLGLGSYIALLYFLFRKLPKNYLPGLVGFVVTNFFGWPCVATALLFWLWFALAEDSHAKS
jgi:O-antigen ligase